VKKIVNRKDTRERIEHVHKKQKKNKDNVHTPLYIQQFLKRTVKTLALRKVYNFILYIRLIIIDVLSLLQDVY